MSFDQKQKDYWETTTNLRTYDHPVVKLFADQRIKFISELLKGSNINNGLDVGCGDGFGMGYMNKLISNIEGCDLSQAMLDANPSDKRLLKCASAYNLPYADSSFDIVYCWELLHHIERPIEVVREMNRVSRNIVVICEPNALNPAMFLFGALKKIERGLLKFTPKFTQNLLQTAGLYNVKQYSVGLFTPNRSPLFMAKQLAKLPYKFPLFGFYSINIGYKF